MARAIRVFAAAAMLAGAGPAASETAWDVAQGGWDMPTPHGETAFQTANDRQFARDVLRATDGALEIRLHPAGTLFRPDEIADTVTRGLVPIGAFLLSRLAPEDALFGVDALPFLAPSHAESRRLWQAARPAIAARLAERNQTLLYAVPLSGQALFLTAEIGGPEALEGMALGVSDLPTRRFGEILGMVPVQVAPDGMAEAFASGRVAAMIASPSQGVGAEAWAVAPQVVDLGAWFPKTAVVVNSEVLAALPAEVRGVLLETAAAAEARGWEMSQAEAEGHVAALRRNGVTVVPPSGPLLDAMQAAGRQMLSEWRDAAGEAGAEILEAYGR